MFVDGCRSLLRVIRSLTGAPDERKDDGRHEWQRQSYWCNRGGRGVQTRSFLIGSGICLTT